MWLAIKIWWKTRELKSLNDLQSSLMKRTMKIHRSIDTLQSDTDRALEELRLLLQERDNREREQAIRDAGL